MAGDPASAYESLARYPLLDTLLGRRSRRFGRGMCLDGGPLAFASALDPQPLTLAEEAAMAFAANGVTGPTLAELPFAPGAGGGGENILVHLALAGWERVWARARVAVPAVLVFTALTLVVTLAHLDRFHLGAPHALITRAGTWIWLAVYAVVPVVPALLLARQARAHGGDPPGRLPLAPALRGMILTEAAAMALLGYWLLVAPLEAAELWPWRLTALTGRAVGAWLVGLATLVVVVCLRRARTGIVRGDSGRAGEPGDTQVAPACPLVRL